MNATSSRPHAPAAQSLSARRRLLDEAAAQLVAAWDTDLDARSPGDPLQKAVGSADSRQAHQAVVHAPQSASASANDPTQSVQLPTDIDELTGRAAGRKRWPWLLAAAGLVATLVVWGASGSDEDESTHVLASSNEPAPAEDQPGAKTLSAAEDSPPEAPTEAQHTLVIRTIPPDASLQLNGVEVDNPYTARHTAAESLHLVASAEKHKPAERDLTLREDVNLMITLSPESKAKRPEAVAKSKARPKRAKQAARKRRAKRQKARADRPKARRRSPKKSSAGFVSSNPYR